MKKGKKVGLLCILVLLIAALSMFVACDSIKEAVQNAGSNTGGVKIEGVYDFSIPSKLVEKKEYSSAQEIAEMIEDVSDGMVSASMIVDNVVALGSARYTIELTSVSSSVDAREYLDEAEELYLAQFKDWKTFPSSPAVYTTKDGKDVLVFLDHNSSKNEIEIYVLFFEAGTVDALASAVDGNGQQGGGGSNGGQSGKEEGKEFVEGETNTIRVALAYDFTAMCKLTRTTSFRDGAEIAAMIQDFSEGMVTADSVVSDVVASKSVVYSILLTAPDSVSKRDYCDFVVDRYHAQFGNDWKYFPNSPVRYKTQNDIDVLVFFGDESDDHSQIDLVVLTFRAGAVDALAESLSALIENGGGSGGNNGGGNNGSYVDGGKVDGDGGKVDGDGGKVDGDGGENGGDNGGNGENGLNEDHPYEVRYAIYDLNAEGEKSLYMSCLVEYGAEISFDWCEYVVFEDPKFEKMIAPDQKIKMEKDLEVYRRDFYDKVPVFVKIHYYVNGMRRTDLGEQFLFFRGQILTDSKFGGTEYEYYRDLGKSAKMFESGYEVLFEKDDKITVYAFREDPLYHKVTFKLGDREIGTCLVYDGSYISQYSAMDLGGTTQYLIRSADHLDECVTRDLVVTITEYDVYHYVPITVHCCYNGDVKYTYVNYEGLDEENRIEISKNREYYTTADCTTLFDGYVTGASTFYSRIEVRV